jgi:hypothetical protein
MNRPPPKSQQDLWRLILIANSLSPSGAILLQYYPVGFIVHLSGANVICGGMQFRLW